MNKRQLITDIQSQKKTRNGILSIIKDISYIVEYEFLHWQKDIKTKEKRKELKTTSLSGIGGTVKTYIDVRKKIQVIPDATESAEWIRNKKNNVEDDLKEDEYVIRDILTFLASICTEDIGISVYSEPAQVYVLKYIEDGKIWSIRPSYWYHISSQQLSVVERTKDLNSDTLIYELPEEEPTDNDFIAFSSVLYDLFINLMKKNVYVRVNCLWSSKEAGIDGIEYLQKVLKLTNTE